MFLIQAPICDGLMTTLPPPQICQALIMKWMNGCHRTCHSCYRPARRPPSPHLPPTPSRSCWPPLELLIYQEEDTIQNNVNHSIIVFGHSGLGGAKQTLHYPNITTDSQLTTKNAKIKGLIKNIKKKKKIYKTVKIWRSKAIEPGLKTEVAGSIPSSLMLEWFFACGRRSLQLNRWLSRLEAD